MKDILEIFDIALQSCDFVVAHNLSFDKKILMVEGIRHNTKIEFTKNGLTPYCTMRNSINLCNIEKVNENIERTISKFINYGLLPSFQNIKENQSTVLNNLNFIQDTFQGDCISIMNTLNNTPSEFAKQNLT